MTPYPKALERFPKLRQSLLSTFDDCALTTKLDLDYTDLPGEFIEVDGKRVEWSGHPQGRGQLTHRALGRCLAEMAFVYSQDEDREAAAEGKIETDVALALLTEVIRQADVPPEEVVNVPMRHVKDIYWIVKKWATDNVWDLRKLVDVEQRLDATLHYPNPEGGEVARVLTGQLDALFAEGENLEHGIVLDWKDTWGMPGPSEVSEGGFFQQRFYGWLIFRNYPHIKSVTLREFYVRYSEAREATIYRSEIDTIEAELSALAERFDRAVNAQVQADEAQAALADVETAEEGVGAKAEADKLATTAKALWRPSPGKHCSYCIRPTACPIFPEARGAGRIEDSDQAEKVAARVVVAEAALKQSKEALKAWADVHGAVPVKDAKGNRVYGYRPTKRRASPKPGDVQHFILSNPGNVTEEQIEKALWKTDATTRFESHIPKPVVEPDDDIMERLRGAMPEGEDG